MSVSEGAAAWICAIVTSSLPAARGRSAPRSSRRCSRPARHATFPASTRRRRSAFALRAHDRVVLTVTGSLADEAAVATLYRRRGAAMGFDPYRRRFCRGTVARHERGDVAAADRHEPRQLRAVLPRRAKGDDRGGGRIVNVSARAGLEWRSGAGMVAYTASKAAVAALTAALAEEVAKDDILVNAVAPSIMDTPANRHRCRRPITRCGRRSRRSPRPSCSSPRRTTA